MSKLLFFGLLGIVIYLILHRRTQRAAAPPAQAKTRTHTHAQAQHMVACAQCGVHVPEAESIVADDGRRHYCCETHRELGRTSATQKD